MSAVYFGGSRSFVTSSRLIGQVVQAVLSSGQQVHVGCQFGVDQQVISWSLLSGSPRSSLVVFAVAPLMSLVPHHVQQASQGGARVVLGAGGQSAPIHARYLLRSVAAFQGCSAAVFFQPGSGSLAVAREAVNQGLPVFAFTQSFNAPAPAPIPSCAGQWVRSFFHPACVPAYQQGIFPRTGWACWRWQSAQQSLF